MFVDDPLLSLKTKASMLRNALQIMQDFATTFGSMCNIENSSLLSITEDNVFDPSCWSQVVVPRGKIVRHLGTLLGLTFLPRNVLLKVLLKCKSGILLICTLGHSESN